MNKEGPIIIIEDDLDDQDLLKEVFKELNLNNEVVFFGDCLMALDYLKNTEAEPFLVLSDKGVIKQILKCWQECIMTLSD